jgi:hypothetical protein
MDLIPRYLQAVKFWLPKQLQDDIIAEISEDIRSQIAEREAELGHPLTDADIEVLLRRRGSPIQVANGYLPQRSLIGPLLFPIYVVVLKIVTLFSLLPAVVGFIAGIVSRALGHVVGTGWTPPFAAIASHFWTGWFASIGTATLVFAVLERTPAKTEIFEKWNPRKLPPLRPAHAIPRSSSVIEIAVNLCVLAWWTAEMAPPTTIHLGNLHIALAPAWSAFYWTILVITLANVIISGINLLRPWWTAQRAVLRVILDLAGGALFCWMFQAHLIASLSWPNATPDKVAYALAELNLWLARIFPWAVAVTVFIAGVGIWRLMKTLRKTGAKTMRTAVV